MRQLTKRSLLALLGGLAVFCSTAIAQSGSRPNRGAASDGSDELSAQDREVLEWAKALAGEVSQVFDRWVASHEVSEDHLFSRLYYPIAHTDPPKYTTDYDGLADRDLLSIEEKYLNKSAVLIFAIATDVNGYVPTHNQKYAMPLTGNRAVDLLNNRTKRLFGDRTGAAAARSEAPYLLQQYKRDTGEMVADLSVPLYVKGRHWGCIRIGYRKTEDRP